MLVYVINKDGRPLMPTKPSKARKLLKDKKAKIVSYKPFTIKLLYGSSGYTQSVDLGIDLGAKHIGVAIVSEDKVLDKGEIELRQDVSENITTRRQYRRSRRNRKTRYRKARFLNRTSSKKEGWLPPSIQSRIDNTFSWIDKFLSLLPNPKLSIEVGKFDIQKMENPDIEGKEYQEGDTFGFYNKRYYVFERDKYTCQVCGCKNKILQTHHIVYKSLGGTDRASNLITVCTDCHTSENHKKGHILYDWCMKKKKMPNYKGSTFMNIIRKRTYKKYPNARITYGSITTPKRKSLGLEKTHYNDAIAITGIDHINKNIDDYFLIKQFRKKKRSLHEAIPRKGRKTKNITAKRNSKNTKSSKGFFLNDLVEFEGQKAYISGFAGTYACYLKDIEENYITKKSKNYKNVNLSECKLINHNNNWQFGRLAV